MVDNDGILILLANASEKFHVMKQWDEMKIPFSVIGFALQKSLQAFCSFLIPFLVRNIIKFFLSFLKKSERKKLSKLERSEESRYYVNTAYYF